MKKNLRFLALISALAISVVSFTGCTEKSDTPSGDSNPTSTDSEQAESEAPAEAPTLKWIQISGQPNDLDMVTEEMNKYSQEKINVKCEFTYLDWAVWGDRVKVIVNSGEPFDIMFTNGSNFTSAVALGAYADITDVLNNDCKKLKDFVPEKLWPAVSSKGKIYAVPTYKDSSQTQYWVWDEELVNKYDIDYKNIHTFEELDPVLYMLKDKLKAGDFSGVDYALPTVKGGVNGWLCDYDLPAGIDSIGVKVKADEAKVVNVLEQDDVVTNLGFVHKWYKDAIINPDAPTKEEGSNKWVPVSSGQGFPGSNSSWAGGRGKPVVSEPFAGPTYSTGTVLGSVNAISASSKYKTEAVKYLELCNLDHTMRDMLVYGLKDVHYTDDGDGTITRDPVKKDDYSPAGYSQATFFTMSPEGENDADQWTKVQEWNEKANSSIILGFVFDRANVETEIANCTAVEERYKFELYTGASNPEEKIPALYKDLEKAGLDTIRQELQKQIDEWIAANK